jgi:hypothetical protein
MAARLTDAQIATLILEPKPLATGSAASLKLRPKRGHRERELDLTGAAGSEFSLILRQNSINVLDFSLILAVRVPGSNQFFRLRRYNGKSHEHTNHIEGQTFYDFHIHMATERYQDRGTREDGYAEPTGSYADFHGALQCLLQDTNILVPPDPQGALFGED